MNTARCASLWIIPATLTLLAPPALAQAQAEPDSSRAAASNLASESATVQVKTRQGVVRVRIEDGRATATLDGVEIPADRVSLAGGVLRVHDDAGKTIFRLDRPWLVGARGSSSAPTPGPRRIIGVVTNPVDGALAAQLDLEPGAALVIESVLPENPAAAAGLKQWDVVTAIDGVSPVTLDRLRAAINAKAQTEALRLSVLRAGAPLTISVVPTAETGSAFPFTVGDAEARDSGHDRGVGRAAAPSRWRLSPDAMQRLQREAMEARSARGVGGAVQSQLERLSRDTTIDSAKRAEIERALHGAAEALGNITFDPVAGLPEVRFIKDGGKGVALFPCMPMKARLAPAPPTPPAIAALADRLTRVERRLERLERLLKQAPGAPTPPTDPKPAPNIPQDKQSGV